jgi:hypothetical protein
MALRTVSLDELIIDDESAVKHVALYDRLKQALRRSQHRFVIPAETGDVSWDRALFLNLTYWSNEGGGGTDVLCDEHIPADVVAHVAWHHVVSRELARRRAAGAPNTAEPADRPSGGALFFAEAIASAFDLYLVGRLLEHRPDSDFITTQVPLIAERAYAAGVSEAAFAGLLADIARDPERAFEDMRALLFDVAGALLSCTNALAAQEVLARWLGHRFEPLLHHFELSNWILYARAYGAERSPLDGAVAAMHGALRAAPVALDILAQWIDADLPSATNSVSTIS